MIRFSRRTNWNTEENDLSCAHRLRVEAGLPTADLTVSNPTRCGFEYDAGLLASLADERALDYDPQPKGLLAAREAVCRYYEEHGVPLDPEQIVGKLMRRDFEERFRLTPGRLFLSIRTIRRATLPSGGKRRNWLGCAPSSTFRSLSMRFFSTIASKVQ